VTKRSERPSRKREPPGNSAASHEGRIVAGLPEGDEPLPKPPFPTGDGEPVGHEGTTTYEGTTSETSITESSTTSACSCEIHIVPFEHCHRPIDELEVKCTGTSECGGYVRGLPPSTFPDPEGISDATLAGACKTKAAKKRADLAQAGDVDHLWILFKLESLEGVPDDATLDVKMDVFVLPYPGCPGPPTPIPTLQGIDVPPQIVSAAFPDAPPKLAGTDYECPSAAKYVADLDLSKLRTLLTFDFCDLFEKHLLIKLRLFCDDEEVSDDSVEADVFDLTQIGSLYQIITEILVRRDAANQGITLRHHPWFPVLSIGANKAHNYMLLVQRDFSLQKKNFGDPCWLMRVGKYLEFLTCLGIYEAVRTNFDYANMLTDEQQKCFLESCQFKFARDWVFGPGNSRDSNTPNGSRTGWRDDVWLPDRQSAKVVGSTPQKSKVMWDENLTKKVQAVHDFLIQHHLDLRRAITLAGKNMKCFVRTWGRVSRCADDAVDCGLEWAFPELDELGILDKIAKGKAKASSAVSYRSSMNHVARDMREARDANGQPIIEQFPGDDAVPPTTPAITAKDATENACAP